LTIHDSLTTGMSGSSSEAVEGGDESSKSLDDSEPPCLDNLFSTGASGQGSESVGEEEQSSKSVIDWQRLFVDNPHYR
jgi:hypothetical protein